jgi:CHASE2 domain-containing sensor protein
MNVTTANLIILLLTGIISIGAACSIAMRAYKFTIAFVTAFVALCCYTEIFHAQFNDRTYTERTYVR